ncbi:MAG: DMT family transporter [Arcobacteraceae bacterium]
MKTIQSHLLVLFATFLVAGSFIASQKISGIIDPISLTLYRFVFATLLLAPFIFFQKKYRIKVVSTFTRALTISLFYVLYFIGLFKALETTNALNTGTLFTIVPLITSVLAIFILKQKMNFKQLYTYLIGIVGTCIVIFKGDLELLLAFSLNQGDIIFLFATTSMAFYSISTKYFHKKDDELLVLVFMTLVGGCIWMFLALNILDIPLQWGKIEGVSFYYMLYLVIGATLMTVYLYQQASINLGPKKVMAYVYLNPVAIALLLFILEGVSISLIESIGIIISAFATYILLKQKQH